MSTRPSLREQEKQRRRQLIADTALRLFAERGYTTTTVEDITAAVGIAPRTFFLHFSSKEDAVFAADEQRHARLAQRLASRPAGSDALDVTLQVLGEWITERGEDTDVVRERVITESPALAARARAQSARYADLLATAISADLGAPPTDLRAAVVAAAAVAGWEVIGRRHAAGGLTVEQVPTLLAQVADFARTGVRALPD